MRILAADTALGACSAAVMDNGKLRASAFQLMARGHAEALAPMVESVMQESGIAFAALDRLAVTTGPGTFTGQRVGLAFMRGLALTLGKPLVGITTLDAMAEAALHRTSAAWAVACADARRGEIYLGARAKTETLLVPVLVSLEDACQRILSLAGQQSTVIALAGTAAPLLAPLLSKLGLSPCDSEVREPDAQFVALLAVRAAEPMHAPQPLYLRAPDVKLPGPA